MGETSFDNCSPQGIIAPQTRQSNKKRSLTLQEFFLLKIQVILSPFSTITSSTSTGCSRTPSALQVACNSNF